MRHPGSKRACNDNEKAPFHFSQSVGLVRIGRQEPEAFAPSPHRDCNKALVRPALGVDKVLRRVIFEILNYFSVFVKSYANCCVIVH